MRAARRVRKGACGKRPVATPVPRPQAYLTRTLIKVTAVASKTGSKSVRDMVEALIAGQRDPEVLAGLARGKMRAKHDRLAGPLEGRFDDHHGELARMLLNQIDALTAHIDTITGRVGELIEAIPGAWGVDADGVTGPGAGLGPGAPVLPAVARLDEVTGIGAPAAQVIIAEVGLNIGVFPTPGHLVSWAKLSPRTIQSGPKSPSGPAGDGNPYLKGVLGEAAASAARTATFLGERYRRIARRRGKLRALVAVARSILVIVWHLLSDPAARFDELGAGYYASRIDTGRKTRKPRPPAGGTGLHRHPQPVGLTRGKPDFPHVTGPGFAAAPWLRLLFSGQRSGAPR